MCGPTVATSSWPPQSALLTQARSTVPPGSAVTRGWPATIRWLPRPVGSLSRGCASPWQAAAGRSRPTPAESPPRGRRPPSTQRCAGSAIRAKGERNVALFQAAANLFEICNTGWLDEAVVRAELTEAALAAGLGAQEVRDTLTAQWRRKQGVVRQGWPSRGGGPGGAPLRGLSPAVPREQLGPGQGGFCR